MEAGTVAAGHPPVKAAAGSAKGAKSGSNINPTQHASPFPPLQAVASASAGDDRRASAGTANPPAAGATLDAASSTTTVIPAGAFMHSGQQAAATLSASFALHEDRDAGARSGGSRLRVAASKRRVAPRLRPKKTHSGLDEKIEATGHAYGVYVHWDEYAGHHVHVLPPEVDAMHADEVLLVPSGGDSGAESRTTRRPTCLSCGLSPSPATASASDAFTLSRGGAQQQPARVQQLQRRQCIPLYKYQPKLCEKSRRIVDEYREMRLREVWRKLDPRGEDVVDFFSIHTLPYAAIASRSTRMSAPDLMRTQTTRSPQSTLPAPTLAVSSPVPVSVGGICGGSTPASPRNGAVPSPTLPAFVSTGGAWGVLQPTADILRPGESVEGGRDTLIRPLLLTPVEERFVEAALLPRFFMAAMLPENRKEARALLAEAAKASDAAAASEEMIRKAKTLAVARDLVLLLESEEATTAHVPSAAVSHGSAAAAGYIPTTAKGRDLTSVTAIGGEGEGLDVGNGLSADTASVPGAILPCLLVSKATFIKAGLHALQHFFGDPTVAGAAAVNAFRDALMRDCGKRLQRQRHHRQQLSAFTQQPLRPGDELYQSQTKSSGQERRSCGVSLAPSGAEDKKMGDYYQANSPLYYKPYIFHYAQHLEEKRREANRQQQDTVSAAVAGAPVSDKDPGSDSRDATATKAIRGRRYLPRCLQPLPLSAAADWPGAVVGDYRDKSSPVGLLGAPAEAAESAAESSEEIEFPGRGLRRVTTRFDEQIAHYVRKKRQLEHLKRALAEMQQREFCSFHPAVNKTPRYLKELRRQRQAAAATEEQQQQTRRRRAGWLLRRGLDSFAEDGDAAAEDPMEILALYCKYYTEDRRYEQLVEEIRECCFQPNVSKFVQREKRRQQQMQQQENRQMQRVAQEVQQQQQLQRLKEKDQQEKGQRGGVKATPDDIFTGLDDKLGSLMRPTVTPLEAERSMAAVRAAATDEIFAKLDYPFDAIFDTDIRQWLQSADCRRYCRGKKHRQKTRRASSCSSPTSSAHVSPCPERTGEGVTTESNEEEEDEEEEEDSQRQRKHEWKNWIREGRQPQYRGPRPRTRQRVVLAALPEDRLPAAIIAAENPLLAEAAAAEERNAAEAARKTEALPLTNPYNRWVEGLRGGYLSNSMNFSTGAEDSRGEDVKKTRRYCMRDWSRYIRLEQRAVEARVVPNREIAESLCEAYMPSAEMSGPTLWTPSRRRWTPRQDCSPSADTYTQANYCKAIPDAQNSLKSERSSSATRFASLFSSRRTSYRNRAECPQTDVLCAPMPSASRAAQYAQRRQQQLQNLPRSQSQVQERGLLRMSRRGGKPGAFAEAEVPTFVVPTPVKAHKIREQFQVYVQLRHGIDSGEISVPPRVCAVKRKDALQALEKELAEEIPQLVLLSRAFDDATHAEEKETEAKQQQVAPKLGERHPLEWSPVGHSKKENELNPSYSRASTAAVDWGTDERPRKGASAAPADPRCTGEDRGTSAAAEEHAPTQAAQRVLVVY